MHIKESNTFAGVGNIKGYFLWKDHSVILRLEMTTLLKENIPQTSPLKFDDKNKPFVARRVLPKDNVNTRGNICVNQWDWWCETRFSFMTRGQCSNSPNLIHFVIKIFLVIDHFIYCNHIEIIKLCNNLWFFFLFL